MAFEFGFFNEFSDSVTIASPTMLAAAKAVKLSPFKGALYQAMPPPKTSITQKTFKVYSRSKTPRTATVGSTQWNASATSSLTVTADTAKTLSPGHVIEVDSEVVVVKSVNATNNTIDVFARGAGGTTAAIHTVGTVGKLLGIACADGDLKNMTSVSETTSAYTNATQLVLEVVNWTKHGELIREGLSPEQATATLILEAQNRYAETLAVMAVKGRKHVAASASDRSMTAGLFAQLKDDNSGARTPLLYNANGALSDAKIKAAFKMILEKGGTPTHIVCSPTVKEYFNNLPGSSHVLMTTGKDDHVGGGVYVDYYKYESLSVKFIVDSDVDDSEFAIIDINKCYKGWLADDGMIIKDEPSQSSREMKKSIQGSIGFAIEDVGYAHAVVYGITSGPAERTYNVQGDVRSNEIVVKADASVPTASASNFGCRVIIGTGWTSGTKIATAVAGEIYASNGTAWIKQ